MICPDLIFLCIFCAQMDLSLEDSGWPTTNGEKEKEWQQNIPVRVLDYCNLLNKLSSENSIARNFLKPVWVKILQYYTSLNRFTPSACYIPEISVLDPNPYEFVIFFSPK
jgi:hypothetical protein